MKLGRYPFKTLLPMYVEHRTTYMAESTVTEEAKKLRYFAEVFGMLRTAGKVGTADPRNMGRKDVEAFLRWMREKKLDETTKRKYLTYLGNYLKWAGNGIIDEMKNDRRIRLPAGNGDKPIQALTLDQIERILQAAENIPGWRGTVLRGYIALAFSSGCRPKEILGSEPCDVDLENMRFYVRHPKGEGSWGKSEWIPLIRGDMLPWITDLLQARRTLENNGTVSQYLFVNPLTNRAYAGNSMRRLKQETEKATGIKWQLRNLRNSLASITVNRDVSKIKAVSLQLRHKSVAMTEQYYARISRNDAIVESIGDEWKQRPVVRGKR